MWNVQACFSWKPLTMLRRSTIKNYLTFLTIFYTSWFLNLSVNALDLGYNVIEQTGKFCPGRDSCRSGRSNRGPQGVENDWKKRNCFCDNACAVYGDCCIGENCSIILWTLKLMYHMELPYHLDHFKNIIAVPHQIIIPPNFMAYRNLCLTLKLNLKQCYFKNKISSLKYHWIFVKHTTFK